MSLENKKILLYNSWTNKHYKNGQKCSSFPSLKKGDLGITMNYRSITINTITTNIFDVMLHNPTRNRENYKNLDKLSVESLQNIIDSDNPLNQRKSKVKEFGNNTTVCRFL